MPAKFKTSRIGVIVIRQPVQGSPAITRKDLLLQQWRLFSSAGLVGRSLGGFVAARHYLVTRYAPAFTCNLARVAGVIFRSGVERLSAAAANSFIFPARGNRTFPRSPHVEAARFSIPERVLCIPRDQSRFRYSAVTE